MTAREGVARLDGEIVELLPRASYRVRLENGESVTAHVGGQMRMHHIRLIVGDKVTVELMPNDLTRARITARLRQ